MGFYGRNLKFFHIGMSLQWTKDLKLKKSRGLREWEDKPEPGRTYLQKAYPTKNSYPKKYKNT